MKPGKDYIGVGGGVLIFNRKGEVLLMKRGKKSKNEAGWWSKPGGSVDYGEKAVDAMVREIKEELDIDVKVWGYLPHTDHIISARGGSAFGGKKEKQHWVAINYLADLKSGTPKIMEPEKCDEIRWFNLRKLPKKITKTTHEPIKYFLQKKYIKL